MSNIASLIIDRVTVAHDANELVVGNNHCANPTYSFTAWPAKYDIWFSQYDGMNISVSRNDYFAHAFDRNGIVESRPPGRSKCSNLDADTLEKLGKLEKLLYPNPVTE